MKASASLMSVMAPSVPGTTATPFLMAAVRALTLSPKPSMMLQKDAQRNYSEQICMSRFSLPRLRTDEGNAGSLDFASEL